MTVYVVVCYDELAGVYSTQAKAEERVAEMALDFGIDSHQLGWVSVTVDRDVVTYYDHRGKR